MAPGAASASPRRRAGAPRARSSRPPPPRVDDAVAVAPTPRPPPRPSAQGRSARRRPAGGWRAPSHACRWTLAEGRSAAARASAPPVTPPPLTAPHSPLHCWGHHHRPADEPTDASPPSGPPPRYCTGNKEIHGNLPPRATRQHPRLDRRDKESTPKKTGSRRHGRGLSPPPRPLSPPQRVEVCACVAAVGHRAPPPRAQRGHRVGWRVVAGGPAAGHGRRRRPQPPRYSWCQHPRQGGGRGGETLAWCRTGPGRGGAVLPRLSSPSRRRPATQPPDGQSPRRRGPRWGGGGGQAEGVLWATRWKSLVGHSPHHSPVGRSEAAAAAAGEQDGKVAGTRRRAGEGETPPARCG